MKRSISTTYILDDFGEFEDHQGLAYKRRNSTTIRRGRMNAGVPDETYWRHERNFNKSETASENSELFE